MYIKYIYLDLKLIYFNLFCTFLECLPRLSRKCSVIFRQKFVKLCLKLSINAKVSLREIIEIIIDNKQGLICNFVEIACYIEEAVSTI